MSGTGSPCVPRFGKTSQVACKVDVPGLPTECTALQAACRSRAPSNCFVRKAQKVELLQQRLRQAHNAHTHK
eukprot:13615044-Alexandrium_andersonii.AAC.1